MMFQSKKVISTVLCLAMLISCLPGLSITASAWTAPKGAKVFTGTDTLAFQAEEGTILDKDNWAVESDKATSGGKYLSATGADISSNGASAAVEPDLVYVVDIKVAGSYALWGRNFSPDNGKNSVYIGADDDKTLNYAETGIFDTWTWQKMTTFTFTEGQHMILVKQRKTGTKLDKFILTSTATTPTGVDGTGGANPTAAPASGTPSPTGTPSNAKTFNTKEGGVMFEAEDITIDKELFVVVSNSAASGGKAISPNIDSKDLPAQNAAAGAAFSFKADKAGTYAIWLRYVALDGGQDSGFASLNGADYKDTPYTISGDSDSAFAWTKMATTVALKEGDTYTVRIRPREKGAQLDKFIITNIASYSPVGMGELPVPGQVNIKPLPADKYPKPTITPPPQHPRLMFRASDIPTIKANWNAAENAAAVTEYNKLLEMNTDGKVTPASNGGTFNARVMGAIEAMAFDYAVNGNEAMGKQAVVAIKNFIENVNYTGVFDPTRSIGQTIFVASEVYDWCYPLMSKDDRAWIVANCENLAAGMEIGWPPSGQGAICGHGGEAQLMRDHLAFSIATYDEYPDIYNYVGGRYLSEFIQTRNYWAPAGTQHQGTSYAIFRRTNDLLGQWLIYRMTGDTVFVPEFGKVDYQWLYTRRPDGELLREGDDYNEANTKMTYWNVLSSGVLLYASGFYKDPYVKRELLRENVGLAAFNYEQQYFTPVDVLLFNDPTIKPKPVGELPKTKYFASPLGQMIARTGWNDGIKAPDAIAFMKIGEVWGSNHNHLDAGNFQIYYKGILASESGWYDSYNTVHDINYHKRSIAHNTLLIYDPDENSPYYGSTVNDGGQVPPKNGSEPVTMKDWIESGDYETGKVLGHEFGPDQIDPEYSYISGDITKAYTSNGKKDKVSEVRRSMIFMPTESADFPAMFMVFDKITAKEASFKKTFMIHSQEEIKTNGNVAVMTSTEDDYNGMLTNQTLLPKDAKLETIGGEGKQFWVNGVNYEPTRPAGPSFEDGWGRLEVTPGSSNKTDYFLNVMYVNDADKTLTLQKAELIESDSFYGAKLMDRAVLFGKDITRVDKESTFTVPGGENSLKIAVAGIKEGTWSVNVNGGEIAREISSKDGGIIYFTGPAGTYTLKYVDGNANKTFPEAVTPVLDGIDIKVGKSFIYSDVPARIVNDRTLLPMRAIFEALGAQLSWDESTSTATATYGTTKVVITRDQKTAYVNGQAKELDVPAMIIDGRFVVPVRFVSEAMGAKVVWDEFARGALITPGKPPKPPIEAEGGYAQIASSTCDLYSDEFYPENSYDNDSDTLWSAEGDHYVDYTLDREYTVTGVEIWLNPNASRTAVFDIWTSADGKEWTKVMDGKGDKKNPDDWEYFTFTAPVKTKYIRYYAHGSDISMWNGLKEIRFPASDAK